MYIHTSSILYCNTPVSKLILHVFIAGKWEFTHLQGGHGCKKNASQETKISQITTRNKRKIILIIYRLVQNKHKLH